MPFRKRARITHGEPRPTSDSTLYYQINYTLTDVPEDAAYFHAQFRRVNPLPYKDVYTILDGVKGAGPLRRHLHGLGREQHRLVGRGRDQVLHRRRRRVPDHLRHRHRGLLLRRLQLRRRHHGPTGSRLPGVHDALRRPAAGDPARRPLPVAAALRPVPLAHHGPDPLRAGPARHHPGAGLAHATRSAYLPLQDDIASVAFWYQTLPPAPFPKLADPDYLEID